jgi:colicin import membrane protein
MADPTGTIGMSQGKESDLALATRGGPKFMQRMQELATAIDRYQQVFAQLGLGQEAETALKSATEQLEAAKADRTAAAAELAAARRTAANILADANRERGAAAAELADAERVAASVRDKERQATAAGDAARQAAAKAAAAQGAAAAVEKKVQRQNYSTEK